MAKKRQVETFGNADPGEMVSPLSYQLNGQGTPEHPCGLLPEYSIDKPLMPIKNVKDLPEIPGS